MNRCSLTPRNGALALSTPYERGMVDAIKQLPARDRQYDPATKEWLVAVKHFSTVAALVKTYFGEDLPMPAIKTPSGKPEQRIIEVQYLGMCKDRADGEKSAFGLDPFGAWSYIFPEMVLRAWFDGTEANDTPTQEKTLYGVLGAAQNATAEELKQAYRRMAMQWHPDRCKEPNAHLTFLRIQEAWEILSNPGKKARYEAGLAFEATLGKVQDVKSYASLDAQYRAPLRCGNIMVVGVEELSRFRVQKILVWQDIYNNAGQVLISSWPMGAKEPVKVWA
jgi:hypothetical protein